MNNQIDVFCGLDVGKSAHHTTALNRAGERLYFHPRPQGEARLWAVLTELQRNGRVLVIVDQPNTIGVLTIAVARDTGCEVACLPRIALRKAALLHPGKAEAGYAFIIADTAPLYAAHAAYRGPEQRTSLRVEGPGRV